MRTTSYGAFHTDPPLLIAVVLKTECYTKGTHRCIKDEKMGMFESYLCAAMPALNMCYQAFDLGISSSLLTPEPSEARKILNIKVGNDIPLLVAFGYEKKTAFQKKRERKPLSELVFYEVFGNKNGRI